MGILANSVEKTHSSSTSDDTSLGYVTASRITLTTTPTGTTYSWALGQPSASSPARAALSAETGASVNFVPDVAGYYNIICTVDGSTVYILRISVEATAVSSLVDSLRHSPKSDSSVPTPALGLAQYFSSTQSTLCSKTSAGLIVPLFTGSIGAALGNADATVQIGSGNVRVLPASTLTANRALTLGTTSAVSGDIIRIIRLDAEAFTYAVINGGVGAGTLFTFSSATKGDLEFRFDGTNWATWTKRAIA